MDEGVRETLCSSCIHRDVCTHKDDYLNIVKSLQEMFYKFPKNERDFMYLRDPDCKFYSKEFANPNPLTQRPSIPKNMVVAMVGDGRKSCAKMIKESAQKYDEKTDI